MREITGYTGESKTTKLVEIAKQKAVLGRTLFVCGDEKVTSLIKRFGELPFDIESSIYKAIDYEKYDYICFDLGDAYDFMLELSAEVFYSKQLNRSSGK